MKLKEERTRFPNLERFYDRQDTVLFEKIPSREKKRKNRQSQWPTDGLKLLRIYFGVWNCFQIFDRLSAAKKNSRVYFRFVWALKGAWSLNLPSQYDGYSEKGDFFRSREAASLRYNFNWFTNIRWCLKEIKTFYNLVGVELILDRRLCELQRATKDLKGESTRQKCNISIHSIW